MKKKFYFGIIIIAIAVVATINVNLNFQNSKISSLCLANVEAMANDGEMGDIDGYKKVEKSVTTDSDTTEEIGGVMMNCSTIHTSCPGKGSTMCRESLIKNCVAKQ